MGSDRHSNLTGAPVSGNNTNQPRQPSEHEFLRLIRGRIAKGTQEELAKALGAINSRLAKIERETKNGK